MQEHLKLEVFQSYNIRRMKLVGIVTNRDLRFEKDLNLPIKKIMTTR